MFRNLFHHFSPIKQARTNDRIRTSEVLLVMEDQAPIRMSTDQALAKAEEMGLDLVEINPNSTPPLCKILDYGKFLYKKKKQEQDARKRVKAIDVKTIRFGFNTSDHDLAIRDRRAREFLDKGDIVRLQVMGRGRQLAYKPLALKKVEKFVENLKDVATVDAPPKMAGNSILVTLRPQNKQ